jgi:hypothetical protein
MRLSEILRECESSGVSLAAKPSGLSVRGELTAELKEDLRHHKPNLLHYLRIGVCHHGVALDACAVCSGRVRRMIEDMDKRERTAP